MKKTPSTVRIHNRVQDVVGPNATILTTFQMDRPNSPEHSLLVVVVRMHQWPADRELKRRFGLTPRECQVTRLLGDRFSDSEIAETLCISIHTVRCHVESILRKLAVHDRKKVRAELLAAPPAPACCHRVQR